MDPQLIKTSLEASNPWWASGRVPPGSVPPHRRREFSAFMEAIDGKYVAVLAGIRRSGKSTLVRQAIEELLSRGVPGTDIVHATLDDLAFLGSGPEVFQAILDVRAEVAGPSGDGKVYAFFDEVQNIPEWGLALKNIWDRQERINLSATGSSGLIIRGVVGESLAGRATTRELGPAELRDWLSIASPDGPWKDIGPLPLANLRDPVAPRAVLGGPIEVAKARRAITPFLGRFMILGGLPEAASATDETAYLEHVFESVVERILFRDLPRLYGIRQPDKVARLLLLLADKSSLPVSVDGLAQALDAHRETIEGYLSFLIGSRAILELYPHTGSEVASARKRRRYYIADTGLQSAILHRDSRTLLDDRLMGILAEQTVAIHLNRLAHRHFTRLYTGPPHRGSEVDFVLDTREGPLPIECKYRSSIRAQEVAALDAYRDEIGADTAVMVTKDTLERHGACVLIPLWMFLLAE